MVIRLGQERSHFPQEQKISTRLAHYKRIPQGQGSSTTCKPWWVQGRWFSLSYVVGIGVWGMGANDDTLLSAIAVSNK